MGFKKWNIKLNFLEKYKFLKLGIPFFLLVVGGSFGLEQFARIRYDYRKQSSITPEELQKHGVSMKNSSQVTMESEYAKLESMDIDTWENIRGPRPWEQPVVQEEQPIKKSIN